MHKHLTEIVFILDRSGSMQGMVEPAISGFNRLLREQQQAPGRMSIAVADTSNFAATGESYAGAKGALSRKITAVRRRSQGATDATTVHDAEAPLESLREDEERKDRP